LLVVGFVALILGVFFESWTERSPIIPPRLFKVGCVLHLRKSLLTRRKPDTYDGTDIFHGFFPLLRVLLWCVILAPMTSAILNRLPSRVLPPALLSDSWSFTHKIGGLVNHLIHRSSRHETEKFL
jgi:hypothetical protein